MDLAQDRGRKMWVVIVTIKSKHQIQYRKVWLIMSYKSCGVYCNHKKKEMEKKSSLTKKKDDMDSSTKK